MSFENSAETGRINGICDLIKPCPVLPVNWLYAKDRLDMKKPVNPPGYEDLIHLLAGRQRSIPLIMLEDEQAIECITEVCFGHAIQYIVADLLKQSGEIKTRPLRQLVDILEHKRYEHAAFQLGANAQLCELAEYLNQRKIPMMLLKGVLLAHILYEKDSLLRPFGDLDILIPETYFMEAISAFLELGYTLDPRKSDLEAIKKYNHKLVFLPDESRCCPIDIHFRLIGKKIYESVSRFDSGVYWREPSTCVINNLQLLIPNQEFLFLHLLIHLSLQHRLAGLGWLYDIKLFLSKFRDFNWELFSRNVEKFQMRRAVWLSLKAAQEILDAAVPQSVLKQLNPPRLGLVARCWFGTMSDQTNVVSKVYFYKQSGILGKVSRIFSEYIFIDGRRERCIALRRWLFPDAKFIRAAFRVSSPWKIFLCYLLHPMTVIVLVIAVGIVTIKYAQEDNRIKTS